MVAKQIVIVIVIMESFFSASKDLLGHNFSVCLPLFVYRLPIQQIAIFLKKQAFRYDELHIRGLEIDYYFVQSWNSR